MKDYHVSSDAAFFLWRPLFAHSITVSFSSLRMSSLAEHGLSIYVFWFSINSDEV